MLFVRAALAPPPLATPLSLFVKLALMVVAIALAGMFTLSILSGAPSEIGLHGNRLAPCPDSDNCVGSMEGDDSRIVPPIYFHGTPERAMEILQTAVDSLPRSRIVKTSERYLHAEFTTAFFRFKDDVEFLLDRGAGLIHVRSASRVGSYDFGVNRKRVDAIRRRFEEVRRDLMRKRQAAQAQAQQPPPGPEERDG